LTAHFFPLPFVPPALYGEQCPYQFISQRASLFQTLIVFFSRGGGHPIFFLSLVFLQDFPLLLCFLPGRNLLYHRFACGALVFVFFLWFSVTLFFFSFFPLVSFLFFSIWHRPFFFSPSPRVVVGAFQKPRLAQVPHPSPLLPRKGHGSLTASFFSPSSAFTG